MKTTGLALALCVTAFCVTAQDNARDYSRGTADRKPGIQVYNNNSKRPAAVPSVSVDQELKAAVTGNTLADYTAKLRAKVIDNLSGSVPETESKFTPGKVASKDLTLLTVLEACASSEAFAKMTETRDGQIFLLRFLHDLDWMDNFMAMTDCFTATSKEKRDVGASLALICEILSDPVNRGDISNPVLRKLATAYGPLYRASHMAKQLQKNDPKAFYASYKKAYKENRLNPDFKNYAGWEMMYVAYYRYDLDGLEWIRKNVNIPKRDMDGACWRAEYHRHNAFGYSIHGPDYYRPWEEAEDPYSRMKTIGCIGGVCGSLSNFGTMSSIAQGIGSFAVGQPGHCAYAIRMKPGEWVGGFGGPGGFSGENPFAELGSESDFIFLIDEIFMNAKTYALSRNLSRAAQLIAEKSPEESLALLKRSVEIQPNNIFGWLGLIARLEKSELSSDECIALGRQLGEGFAKRPAVALLLAKKLAPKMGAPAAQLPFYEIVMRNGADAWSPWQWKLFMNDRFREFNNPKEVKLAFCNATLRAYGKAKFFPEVIAWAQEKFKDDAEARQTILANLVGTVSGGGSGDPETFRKTIAQLILMSGENGSVDAFRQFGELAEKNLSEGDQNRVRDGERLAKEIKAFPGECLSEGGIFKPTTTSGWDAPLLHARILTPRLGFYHTSSEVKPGCEITLARLGEPSGIVIVAGSGNNWRVSPIAVSVSEDGKTWEQVFRDDKYQDIYRIDLSDKPRRVRYVKVWRDDDRKEVHHLRGVIVYGRRLQ